VNSLLVRELALSPPKMSLSRFFFSGY